jgi:CPA2 family monovalent cation:H+ antiporter-2
MQIPILTDIVIILGLSVFIILIFHKLKLPSILGLLITGAIVGPYGLNLITSEHGVELLAEIGIIFLLFVIGIEFSLKGIIAIKNTVLFGGILQVGGTIGLVALIAYLSGLTIQTAIFLGFLIALSSTAIVLKMFQEKGELTSPHGRISLAILIFQDIIVVLLMLLTPVLAGQSANPALTLFWLLLKVIAIVIAIYLLARYIIPVVFKWIARTKISELYIITPIVICFATAWLTNSLGLSLALGAFFAGLIISESDYNHQATANILPFREIFISFFFVSVGMLLDLSFFLENILMIHLLALGVILIKMLIIGLTVYLLRYPMRTILLTSLAIFQVGEFSFLLSTTGMEYELLSREIYQVFLAISIISMGVTPFLINYSPRIANYLVQLGIPAAVKVRLRSITKIKDRLESQRDHDWHDHLVIIGFGMNGQNVAKAARRAKIPYVIVELDPEVMQNAKSIGEPVVFGDATSELILKHVNVQNARVVVVAISADQATRQIVQTVRSFTETSYIIVRTRYIKEVETLTRFGADEVIPEEFETSVEIFTRVLNKYLVPHNEVMSFINEIRQRNYEVFRSIPGMETDNGITRLHIPDVEIAIVVAQQGKNMLVGHTIYESGVRSKFGVTILAIKRNNRYITEISPDVRIVQDDVLYLFGRADGIQKLNKFLKLEI